MKPTTLLSKLQSHATSDQALIKEEVKDKGGTIILQFNSGMFALVVKPALSSLSKNFERVTNGHHISLPDNPVYVRDKQGLLVNIKMEFFVTPPVIAQQQSRKVVLHLYTTQTKLMTQGATLLSDSTSTLTTAQWFVSNFVFPSIEAQVARSGTNNEHVSAMNKAILSLRPATSKVSSLHPLPALSQQNGANILSVDLKCAMCDAQLDGRTKNKKVCCQCKGLFHVKCLPNHPCAQGAPPFSIPSVSNENEESDDEDMSESDLSLPHIIANPPHISSP